jgi:C4-dicarboxylate transporter DctM subunit
MGNDFGQMVSDATGGAVTVEVYAADQLTSGSQTEGIQGVIDGTIELSAHSNIIYSNFDARLNVVSLPFLFDSYDDVDAKLDGDAGKAVGEVVESMGLHLLGIAENGFRHPTNSVRPIESLADMKGLKLRVAGSQLLNAEYEAWGANWTNANWSEVYTGLQTGTYDGQENPLPTADGASISDVQKYVTYWTGVYDCIFFTMNGDLYDSLSPELQAIVDECGQKAAQNQRELEREGDQEVLEKWKAAGVTVTELSDEAVEEFKAASASIYTDPTFVDMIGQDLIDAFTK